MGDLRDGIRRATEAKHGLPPDGQPTLEEGEERRGFGIPDNAMRVLQDFEAEVPKPNPEQPDSARAENPPEPRPDEEPRKLLRAERIKRLEIPHVRRALAIAARKAKPGQRPVAVYSPKNGRDLVVLGAEDLAQLIGEAETRGAPDD